LSKKEEEDSVRDDLQAMRAGYSNPIYPQGADKLELVKNDFNDQSLA